MENIQEFTLFAREMLSQKPNKSLVKVYLLGSVLTVLGTAVALLETVCQPFSSGEPVDPEMLFMMAKQQSQAEAESLRSLGAQVAEEEEEEKKEKEEKKKVPVQEIMTETLILKPKKTHEPGQRSAANRLHAS
ncbi:G0/G1 switch protein 2-like [Cololabis saira]|uniref:G0/G1 switch protein 2-like n=1 Tax=Cololabis saira TaxID=129043 RepID=UPI002AD42C0C|nr:G0/G1 switch protein 2-like [Cololabis saira]